MVFQSVTGNLSNIDHVQRRSNFKNLVTIHFKSWEWLHNIVYRPVRQLRTEGPHDLTSRTTANWLILLYDVPSSRSCKVSKTCISIWRLTKAKCLSSTFSFEAMFQVDLVILGMDLETHRLSNNFNCSYYSLGWFSWDKTSLALDKLLQKEDTCDSRGIRPNKCMSSINIEIWIKQWHPHIKEMTKQYSKHKTTKCLHVDKKNEK